MVFVPTTYWDGGDEVMVGGSSYVPNYTQRLDACGARDVPDLDLSVGLTYNAKGSLTIEVNTTLNTYINLAPNKPATPSGQTTGTLQTTYEYTTSTTDPDGDQVYYMWNWGDGTFSEWMGPYDSGEGVTGSHSWETSDTYQIRVKAKDEGGAESIWSNIKYAYFEGVPYVCGNANGDQSLNVSDAVFIINYVFAGGQAPDPMEAANANCDPSVNVSDAVYIINYVFAGGNPPCDTNGDGIPDC